MTGVMIDEASNGLMNKVTEWWSGKMIGWMDIEVTGGQTGKMTGQMDEVNDGGTGKMVGQMDEVTGGWTGKMTGQME